MESTRHPILSKTQASDLRALLLAWYDSHARDLPWRNTRDPYRIWVSEIMLQQTRVAAVIDHYHEFLRRFPTVQKLARARQSSVLAAWSGLGYYRRARMLHAAAKIVVRELSGNFPLKAADWRSLPGIGRYTSAAIASIAFNEPVAVVDGNVERVMNRISGRAIAGDSLWDTANAWLDRDRPGDFNQAMMELGATVCTPRAPSCLFCPISRLCVTRGELPSSEQTTPQKKREIHYALCSRVKNGVADQILLVQRAKDASLMAGMWELPQLPRAPRNARPLLSVRHSITVTDYKVRVWPGNGAASLQGKWLALSRIAKLPITGLTRKILRQGGLLIPGKTVSGSRASNASLVSSNRLGLMLDEIREVTRNE